MRHQSSDVLAVAAKLTAWKREASGATVVEARNQVARDARIAPGSLERLAAGRLKYTDRIAGALNDLLIRTIERKISELEHELFVAKSVHQPSVDVVAVEAALDAARKAMGKQA